MTRRMLLPLLVLCLVLTLDLCCYGRPIPDSLTGDIPADFEAPLELPIEHFGMEDEYGILPFHPKLIRKRPRPKPKGLLRSKKTKRDDPDIEELYYDII